MSTMFFSSPIGLGHATRDVSIAKHLENVKFVSGTPASRLISEHGFSVEDIYKPPVFDVQNGVLEHSFSWLLKYYSYYRKCKKISTSIISNLKPNLVVSDEDFASLGVAQEKKIKSVLITDIQKTGFTKGIQSVIEKKMNKSMVELIKKSDLVILPEDGPDDGNIARVGPIVRTTPHSREELRRKFSFDKKTIVVTAGGTSAGRFLLDTTISVFNKSEIDAELVIVSGPSLTITQNVRNLGFVNNLHEIIFAADLVISLAGKSTIDEARHYGTPGIFIPIKNHFEQEENARELGFTFDDINRLELLISEKINEKRNPIMTNGTQRAVQLIRKLS